MSERYLEDFEAGQTFRSGRILVDADRLKSFAAEFDPQPFISTKEPPPTQYFEVSLQVDGTPPRLR